MSRIAFVTCDHLPTIAADDCGVATILGRHGVEVIPVPWSSPTAAWSEFNLIILRSCWDYHHRSAEFRSWLELMERSSIPLLNPVELVRWNIHKSYLQELATYGLPTLPTVWLPRGSSEDLENIMRREGWKEAVIEPMVSADADNTFRSSDPFVSQTTFQLFQKQHDTIVQQFSEELVKEGELSLIFFDMAFSHMIRKIPSSRDFRTQKQFNPTLQVENPSGDLLLQVSRIFSHLSSQPLYARIDGVVIQEVFTLVEVELIEPWLALGMSPRSSELFAEAILKRLC